VIKMSVQNKDGKRVLITGITGFISTYLAKNLLERHRPVNIVMLLSNQKIIENLGFNIYIGEKR